MKTLTHLSQKGPKSIVRSITHAGRALRKRMWLWPLIAAVLLGIVGFNVRRSVEHALQAEMAANLQAILRTDVAALRFWYRNQTDQVTAVAADDDVVHAVEELIADIPEEIDAAALLQSKELANVRAELDPWIEYQHDDDHGHEDEHGHFHGFVVVDRAGRIIAGERDDLILLANGPTSGQFLSADARAWVKRVLAGETLVTPPFASKILMHTEDGEIKAGLPTMYALAPIKDHDGAVLSVLGLQIRPEDEFTEILSLGTSGESGETYAFDNTGTLLSQSRFDDDLKRIGLLRDLPDERSILNIQLRDPGVDMTAGERPDVLRSEQPFTRMAARALEGESDVDVSGYRDYRGASVIGAWTWLPEYDIGVACEVEVREAYATLYIVRRTFWSMFGLLVLSAIGIFVYMLLASKWQTEARAAAIEARRLGQYQLEEKLGEGGMGVVYRAHHAMLQRPTAVKLLNAENTNENSIARFEREVQMTSQLNHPNTIAIYDYGRTPEDVFYYAMEYLDGMPLDELVDRYGPLPENRMVNILLQVCGSLGEAHEVGLIHRDIKPANIMLNRRGGDYDVVKVLDFGLVKAVDGHRQVSMTAANTIAGTPQYLSPEGIETPDQVDARSDIYAIGSVGYFLLTGGPVFDGESMMEVCMKQINALPESLSQRSRGSVTPAVESAIMQCLEKNKEARPRDVWELANLLSSSGVAPWTRDEARRWWDGAIPPNDTTKPATNGAVGASSSVDETVFLDQSRVETQK